MKKTYQLTAQGRKELELELDKLKGRRGDIADKIAEARDYGDLSENAEYDAAREEQGLVETRIAEIEDILMNAQPIAKSRSHDIVGLGAMVTLENSDKQVTYTVVGPVEANPLEGKVSDESPVGKALVGKKTGEKVEIFTPKGKTTYEIKEIK
jgi:transcription elongation factor GreA